MIDETNEIDKDPLRVLLNERDREAGFYLNGEKVDILERVLGRLLLVSSVKMWFSLEHNCTLYRIDFVDESAKRKVKQDD